VSSSDAVFLIVSLVLVFLYTAWNIKWMMRRNKLYRELMQLVKDAEAAKGGDEPQAPDEDKA